MSLLLLWIRWQVFSHFFFTSIPAALIIISSTTGKQHKNSSSPSPNRSHSIDPISFTLYESEMKTAPLFFWLNYLYQVYFTCSSMFFMSNTHQIEKEKLNGIEKKNTQRSIYIMFCIATFNGK